jgi:SPP1 gp7 family putative phage head morphogenesis protein
MRSRLSTTRRTVLGFETVPFEEAIARIRNLTGIHAAGIRRAAGEVPAAGIHDRRHDGCAADRCGPRRASEPVEGGRHVDDFRKAVANIDGGDVFGRTHLETVFQTNVQRAYQGGKAEQMSDDAVVAVMPFWQYRTAGDARVRPAHAALDGFTAMNNDPVWGRIYPPCGYNCRCTVIPLSQDEAPANASEPGAARIPAAARSVPDPGFGGF